MNVLGIDDFFYVPDRVYDRMAERALPHYHDAHKLLVECMDAGTDEPFDFLDLGVGSGVTSAYILKNFPRARGVGVDLFDQMLEDARARLAPFQDRMSLVRADMVEYLRGHSEKKRFIVSAFCVHHQDEPGKRGLFQLVCERLLPGGRFLMLDLTTFADGHLRSRARSSILDHMKRNVRDKIDQAQWEAHWRDKNRPSPADDMVAWLRETGMVSETFYRDQEIALICSICNSEK